MVLMTTLIIMWFVSLILVASIGYSASSIARLNQRNDSVRRTRAADSAMDTAVQVMRSDLTMNKGAVGKPCLSSSGNSLAITVDSIAVTVTCTPKAVAADQHERWVHLAASVPERTGSTSHVRAEGDVRLIDVSTATAAITPGFAVVVEDWQWCNSAGSTC